MLNEEERWEIVAVSVSLMLTRDVTLTTNTFSGLTPMDIFDLRDAFHASLEANVRLIERIAELTGRPPYEVWNDITQTLREERRE